MLKPSPSEALPTPASRRILAPVQPLQPIADVVLAALARQLELPLDDLMGRQHEALDRLGLDSHGLMRVLLDIERALKLSTSLQLDDAALATPATLVAGVAAAAGPV